MTKISFRLKLSIHTQTHIHTTAWVCLKCDEWVLTLTQPARISENLHHIKFIGIALSATPLSHIIAQFNVTSRPSTTRHNTVRTFNHKPWSYRNNDDDYGAGLPLNAFTKWRTLPLNRNLSGIILARLMNESCSKLDWKHDFPCDTTFKQFIKEWAYTQSVQPLSSLGHIKLWSISAKRSRNKTTTVPNLKQRNARSRAEKSSFKTCE